MVAIEQSPKVHSVYRHVERLMGNRFEITVTADDGGWAAARIDEAVAEIKRIVKESEIMKYVSHKVLIKRCM